MATVACTDQRAEELISGVSVAGKRACPPGKAKKGQCLDPRDAPVEPVLLDPPPPGGLLSPVRATVTPGGRLLVTDARHRMLLRVDPETGIPDQSLALPGQPSGVALAGGRIFVGNKSSQTVDVYRADGGSSLGSFPSGLLENPSDLAADPGRGLVFVADARKGQVLVFDTLGSHQGTIGSRGLGPEELYVPMGVAVDTSLGQVLVSDWGDFGSTSGGTAQVKVFGYDGSFVEALSGAGECGMLGCSGGFSRPAGLTVSDDGRLFLADLLLAGVLVYDRTTLTRLELIGTRPRLRLPSDVDILGGTDVLVVSNGTRSIESFPGRAQ